MPGEQQQATESNDGDGLDAEGKALGAVLTRLTDGRDQVAAAVRDVEDAVSKFAGRQDSQWAELRQRLDQVEIERRQAEAENRSCAEQAGNRANEALTRTEDGLRRVEALAAACEAGDASTAELLGRLSANWHALSNSVNGIEQRVAEFAARQDSQSADLRQLLEQVERERRQAQTELRACGEHAANRASQALARGEEALRRIEALAATAQTRAAKTTELLGRLSSEWETLMQAVRGIEQRVSEVAAHQDAQFDGLRQGLDQVESERRQVEAETRACDERAAVCASEALTRGEEAFRRIEALASASRTRAASTAELLGRLSDDWDALVRSVRGIERRVTAVPTDAAAENGSASHPDDGVGGQPPSPNGADPPLRSDDGNTKQSKRDRHRALAAWVALTAPGILLTQTILAATLVAVPWITASVYVAPAVSGAAVALLLAEYVSAVFLYRAGVRVLAAAAFVALLGVEAVGAGVLLGVDLQPRSPALAIAVAVVAMSWMAGGPMGTVGAAIGVAAGLAGAARTPMLEPLLTSGSMGFSPTLNVQSWLATVPALATTTVSFPTTLSVETFYAGTPVLVGSSTPLLLPALALSLLAVFLGGGVNVLRGRKAAAAVAAAMVAAHRITAHL